MKKRIAIIGGGIAGLAAAWKLGKAGMEPCVFEAKKHPGGRAGSVCKAGAIFDLGAWTFTAGSRVHHLAREAGLDREMVRIPVTVGRHVRGRLRAAHLQKPLSLVCGRVFSGAELFSCFRMMRLSLTNREHLGDEPFLCGPNVIFPALFSGMFCSLWPGFIFSSRRIRFHGRLCWEPSPICHVSICTVLVPEWED